MVPHRSSRGDIEVELCASVFNLILRARRWWGPRLPCWRHWCATWAYPRWHHLKPEQRGALVLAC
jgi:hypothetical protein